MADQALDSPELTSAEPYDQPCDICGCCERVALFRGPDRLHGFPGTFQVMRCRHCGTFAQWPRLPWSELKVYYEGDYDSYSTAIQDDPSRLSRAVRRVYPLKMRRYVERFCRSGRLLDVGCGSGLFLEEMQRAGGWQLQGIEPTASAAQYVRQRFGLPVTETLFEQAELEPEHYDVLTLWNVFEHVYSPTTLLRKAWQALRPGGYLIFTVPNYESLSRWLFGRFWVGWELPRHLYVLPRATLRWKLEQCGFRVSDDRCFLIAYSSLGHSLTFWQQSWPPALQPWAAALQRLYYSPVGRLGLFPAQTLVEQLGLATITTWAVQKVATHVDL